MSIVHYQLVLRSDNCIYTGFIQANLCKIQGILKDTSMFFKDDNAMKNTDLSFNILLHKC